MSLVAEPGQPGRLERLPRPRRAVAIGLGVIAGLCVVSVIVLVFLPLSRAYDLEVFLRAGGAIVHGLSVYPPLGSPAVYSGFSFVYPFAAAWPFVPLAGLAPHAATTVFFIVSLAAMAVSCLVLSGADPWRTTLVLASASAITGLQLGALSPLLFAGVALMWSLREHPRAVGLLAAPLVCSKLFLAPVLVWLLLARRYRAFFYASALTIALLAAGFLLGAISPRGYLQLLSQLTAHEANNSLSLIAALVGAGVSTGAAKALALAVAAAVVCAAYLGWRSSRDERLLYCAGVIAALLSTPILWSHYLVIAAAPMLVLRASRRWFVVVAVASWVIHPPHGVQINPPPGTGPLGPWLAIAFSIAVVGYCAVAARPRPSLLR